MGVENGMRRFSWFVIAVCGCSTAPRAVKLATPLATHPPPPSVPLGDEAPLPPTAVLARSASDGAWARTFPKAPTFTVVEVSNSSRVVLQWRIGSGHNVKELPPDEDYPANYVAPIDLVVRSRGGEKTIALGDRAGSPDPAHQSYCARGRAPNPSAAVWFSVGIMQGDSEFLVVRDGDTLHLLHRETSDGSCQEKKQGPLETCEGSEWERVSEIRGTRNAGLFEIVTDEGKNIDCTPRN